MHGCPRSLARDLKVPRAAQQIVAVHSHHRHPVQSPPVRNCPLESILHSEFAAVGPDRCERFRGCVRIPTVVNSRSEAMLLPFEYSFDTIPVTWLPNDPARSSQHRLASAPRPWVHRAEAESAGAKFGGPVPRAGYGCGS